MSYPLPRPSRYVTKVRRSAAGLGLYAEEEIPKGRFIIEYWGTLLSEEKADEVGGRYLFDLENGHAIDGSRRENSARYINHSCRPNAEVRTKGDRVFIHATRRIRAGEEIGYDYGKEYFNHYIKPYGCKCASCVRKREKGKKK